MAAGSCGRRESFGQRLATQSKRINRATVLCTAGAIIAGMLVALVLLVAVEFFSAVVHPFPSDFGGTHEEICAHVERYPAWVLAVVVPAWAGTALASTWITGRLLTLDARPPSESC